MRALVRYRCRSLRVLSFRFNWAAVACFDEVKRHTTQNQHVFSYYFDCSLSLCSVLFLTSLLNHHYHVTNGLVSLALPLIVQQFFKRTRC